jgi:hypothetical protein
MAAGHPASEVLCPLLHLPPVFARCLIIRPSGLPKYVKLVHEIVALSMVVVCLETGATNPGLVTTREDREERMRCPRARLMFFKELGSFAPLYGNFRYFLIDYS